MQRSDFPAAICLPCLFSLSGILALSSKSNRDLTGCLGDVMCSANGPSTPGLPAPLAKTRRSMLPSSLRKPWAGSDRKQGFRSSNPFTAGQPTRSVHPHYLSVYASTCLLPATLQHSILGLWLRATQAGNAVKDIFALAEGLFHRSLGQRPRKKKGCESVGRI